MPQLYKVTDRYGCTTNGTRWGPNVTHTADELFQTGDLSPASVYLYAYRSPELATLFAPVHLSECPGYRLWIAEGDVKYTTPTSAKCESLTTVKEASFPHLDIEQRVRFCVLATLKVFQNDAWRLWALNWLMSEETAEHQTSSAKAAAEMAGTTAEQRATNATGQYVFKTNMYRSGTLFRQASQMPEDTRLDAMWQMEVGKQTAEADAAAAQAACWSTDAVASFLCAKPRDIEMATRLLTGLQRLANPGWLASMIALVKRARFANSLANAIAESLGWAETAAERKCLAAATKAESDARESWKAIDDVEERNALRDRLRKCAITNHEIDFQSVAEAQAKSAEWWAKHDEQEVNE